MLKNVIPPVLMHAPAPALFDFVAQNLKDAGCADGETAGFTFSFPVAQVCRRRPQAEGSVDGG